MWESADPILGQYLSGERNGGVFNPLNMALYTYVQNSPLIYTDPDGEFLTSTGNTVLQKSMRTYGISFQTQSVVDKIASFVPFTDLLVSGSNLNDVITSDNAAPDVKDSALLNFGSSVAADVAGGMKGKIASKVAEHVRQGAVAQGLGMNVVGLLPTGDNNAATSKGWKNMTVGRGYDDPRFKREMLNFYDKKYGTHYVEAETKLHGHIDALDFHSKSARDSMIQEARQYVIDIDKRHHQ